MNDRKKIKEIAINMLLTTSDRTLDKAFYFLPTEEIMDFITGLDEDLKVSLQNAVEETVKYSLSKAVEQKAYQADVRTTIHINGSFFRFDFSVIQRRDKRFSIADLQVLKLLTMDQYLDAKQEISISRTEMDPTGINSAVEEMVSILQFGAKSRGS